MVSRRQLLALALGSQLRAQGQIRIEFDGSVFRVYGIPAAPPDTDWEARLSVFVNAPDAPAMLGKYSFSNGTLTFTPRFGVSPGMSVRAVYQQPGGAPIAQEFRQAPQSVVSATFVEQVYPSSDLLPANLLRFYIQFSAPMQRGMAWQHLRLLNNEGRPLELPFLELDQELWDQESRRLTVLFDPGRIKRGVLPREEVGSALISGSSYTLAVDAGWRDAQGAPLQRPFEKRFKASSEARQGIDVKTWRISAPSVGSREPVTVVFPKPLDYALLHRLLTVHAISGLVAGTAAVSDRETRWKFQPNVPWSPGQYRLRIDTALEDVAGNRVGRPFDVDTFAPVTKTITRKYESLPIRLRS